MYKFVHWKKVNGVSDEPEEQPQQVIQMDATKAAAEVFRRVKAEMPELLKDLPQDEVGNSILERLESQRVALAAVIHNQDEMAKRWNTLIDVLREMDKTVKIIKLNLSKVPKRLKTASVNEDEKEDDENE